MHYFLCQGGPVAVSTRSVSGDITPNLCFCIRCDLRSHSVLWSLQVMKRWCTIFHAWVGWVWNPHKVLRDTLRQTCVLQPLRSTSHVVHSDVSGPRCVDALFFMLRWGDWYGFYNLRTRTSYTIYHTCVFASGVICESRCAFWCVRATKHRCTSFHARVGPVRVAQKARWDMLCWASIFPSCVICGSHSAFCCVQGAKHRCTIFHARVGPI
jgi:hypothetical protein